MTDISREAVEAACAELDDEAKALGYPAGHKYAGIMRAQADRIQELEGAIKWQADTISANITENDTGEHRLLLDGKHHTGPVVDWVHGVLTGLEKISRSLVGRAAQ